MKILIIADVHGKFGVLQEIMDDVENLDFDVIVCPGDFTDMFDIPTNFTQLDVADIVIQKLLIPNKPLYCVPGNHDPYEIIDVFDDYGINLHGKKLTHKKTSFVGFGGASTPFNTHFEPDAEETKASLLRNTENTSGEWVLVVHSPPKGTSLDLVGPKKHVGSAEIKDIIIKKKPPLVISAHIHENSGTDKIGVSTVFYPGPAYNGYYGIAEINGKDVNCLIKRAKK